MTARCYILLGVLIVVVSLLSLKLAETAAHLKATEAALRDIYQQPGRHR